jgi:hypothetical protein
MKTAAIDRLETRVSKELKRSLRVYCANNDLTLQEGVELAIARLTERPQAVSQEKDGTPAGA